MMITQPGNLDALAGFVHFRLGEFAPTTSITIVRTSLVAAIRFLAPRWNHKYLIWGEDTRVDPQPEYIPSGYVYINTRSGYATILDDNGNNQPYADNDVYRNPFVTFDQPHGIIVDSDQDAIVLAATYLIHLAKLSNSADTFVTWKTEDISYSNLGAERSKTLILESLRKELDELFKRQLGKPKIIKFKEF